MAGEYAFYNGGAWLGDVPTARLYDIAYFLLHREVVGGIADEAVVEARAKAERHLEEAIRGVDADDDTGLPAGLANFGIPAADGSVV